MAYTTPSPATNKNALTYQAINYYNNANNTYFALGKTSAWGTTDTPTNPTSTDNIQEVFGYLKPSVDLCYQVASSQDNTTIQFGNIYLEPTSIDKAYTNHANYIYYTATLSPNDFTSVDSFRQVGLSLNVHTNNTGLVVPATDVLNAGYLHYLYNRIPITISTDENYIISSLVQVKSIDDANAGTTTTSATTQVTTSQTKTTRKE